MPDDTIDVTPEFSLTALVLVGYALLRMRLSLALDGRRRRVARRWRRA